MVPRGTAAGPETLFQWCKRLESQPDRLGPARYRAPRERSDVMDRISLRLSEEEKELLRRQAEEAGVSVSELIRDRLFPKNLSGTPATFGQVSGLTGKVAALSAAVEKLSEKVENDAPAEPVPESKVEIRLDEIAVVLSGLSEQVAGLRETLIKRETSAPGWASWLSRNR